MKELQDNGAIKEPSSEIEELILLAGNYSDDYNQTEKVEIDLDQTTKVALEKLSEVLDAPDEPEDLQNSIYQIAKENEIPPKDFFKILYQIILARNRGPKIGPFILDIGRKNVSQTLSKYIS